jgi:hypothetical protein
MNIFSQIIFPVFGLVMILIALGAFFLPYGRKIKGATQKFDAFGVKMEISVVTAIMLGGMLFCGVGFYLNENSYQKKYNDELSKVETKDREITKLNDENHQLNNSLNFFKAQSISYRFVLDDLDEHAALPPANNLICVFYKNWDKTDSIIYRVYPGEAKSYMVTFENLSLQQLINASPVVCLVNSLTKKRWVAQSFNPLTPYLLLKPDE